MFIFPFCQSSQILASFYEWTSWSACGAGCAGERSRVCGKSSRTTGKDSCSPPETFFSQNCDEENCGKESKFGFFFEYSPQEQFKSLFKDYTYVNKTR